MEIKTFKIRLSYSVSNPDPKIKYDTIYIDETNDFNKLYNRSFEWNWLNVAGDYSEPEKQYRENYNKLYHGYDDSDVTMDVTYKDGLCCVELLVSKPLDTPVTTYDSYRKTLTTRTLFDWIKISLDGHLSDGVGENPVAYYDNRDNEVWLSDIITDEKLNEDGNYFYIGEPIRVINDPIEVEKIMLPDFAYRREQIVNKYTEYYDDNKQMVKTRDHSKIYHECEILNNEAIEFALSKIAELYDK